MKLTELKEEIVYEDDEIQFVFITEDTGDMRAVLKGKAGHIVKDINKLAKKGIQKAGIISAYAGDHMKRYKKFKKTSKRAVAFYARNVWEKKAYDKIVKTLTKSGKYKVIKTYPYPGGARVWEIRAK